MAVNTAAYQKTIRQDGVIPFPRGCTRPDLARYGRIGMEAYLVLQEGGRPLIHVLREMGGNIESASERVRTLCTIINTCLQMERDGVLAEHEGIYYINPSNQREGSGPLDAA